MYPTNAGKAYLSFLVGMIKREAIVKQFNDSSGFSFKERVHSELESNKG